MIRDYRRPLPAAVAVLCVAACAAWPAWAQLGVRWVLNEVTADFAVSEGHPLVKLKFNLYDPVGPTMQQFEQNVALVKHNIKHEYYVGGNGGHDWATWRHLLYCRFLPGLWRSK